jgi:hypothetical protein
VDVNELRKGGAAALFLLGVDAGYNIMGGSNSSPQTTEVFGKGKRRVTLMKWVYIAHIKILAYTGFAAFLAPKGTRKWPLIGGLIVIADMHSSYTYAARCADRNPDTADGDIDHNQAGVAGVGGSDGAWRGMTVVADAVAAVV